MANTTATASERKYLIFWNKIGYGSGDLAANMVHGILTSFVMMYLTDAVGLEGAVIGTLIMLSKFFDGFTDIIFGNLMDKTHSKMGKARPWMLYSQIGNSIFLVLCFSIPLSLGKTAQYAFFFIAYTCLNAIFFTANNIAYAALTSLITRNTNERVQLGVFRFVFALATNMVIANITLRLVAAFGGGAAGWRMVAIIYAIVSLVVNTIAVMSVKELPPEEGEKEVSLAAPKDEIGIIEAVKILFQNKYFIMIALVYILTYLQSGMMGAGVYFYRDVMGNENLYGLFSLVGMLPMIIGLLLTPMLVNKLGSMYKLNLYGYILAAVGRVGFVLAVSMKSIPLMVVTLLIASLGAAPLTGTLNALISSTTDLTYKTKGVHVEGAMFSASSVGIKVGGGVGTALSGLLLSLGGYVANAQVQPQSHINMMTFEFLYIPLIIIVLMILLLSKLNVEQANKEWDAQHAK